MGSEKKRGKELRQFILDNVEHHPRDIVTLTANAFTVTRPAIFKHIKRLIEQGEITAHGTTKNRHYSLAPQVDWEQIYTLDGTLAESVVWNNDVAPLLKGLPENIIDIWHCGVTEIVNNAIDHSNGSVVTIRITKTAAQTEIAIFDNGEGIFKKIQRELGLLDERHSVLELSKGKLTTDPDNHSGEGIFFSSRMFNNFTILSGNVYFSHTHNEVEDWILEFQTTQEGTGVFMRLSNNATRTTKEIYDAFASEDEDYGFTKTVVPVKLAQYGDDKLVSRSQAKRLLVRIDKFKTVIFDFTDVEMIGQAFADEVFRVFAMQHPDIELLYINCNRPVIQMISRAINTLNT